MARIRGEGPKPPSTTTPRETCAQCRFCWATRRSRTWFALANSEGFLCNFSLLRPRQRAKAGARHMMLHLSSSAKRIAGLLAVPPLSGSTLRNRAINRHDPIRRANDHSSLNGDFVLSQPQSFQFYVSRQKSIRAGDSVAHLPSSIALCALAAWGAQVDWSVNPLPIPVISLLDAARCKIGLLRTFAIVEPATTRHLHICHSFPSAAIAQVILTNNQTGPVRSDRPVSAADCRPGHGGLASC